MEVLIISTHAIALMSCDLRFVGTGELGIYKFLRNNVTSFMLRMGADFSTKLGLSDSGIICPLWTGLFCHASAGRYIIKAPPPFFAKIYFYRYELMNRKSDHWRKAVQRRCKPKCSSDLFTIWRKGRTSSSSATEHEAASVRIRWNRLKAYRLLKVNCYFDYADGMARYAITAT